MENEDYHFKFKLTILGNKGVGKSKIVEKLGTSLCKRWKTSASEEQCY
jgi:hypothetical protein